MHLSSEPDVVLEDVDEKTEFLILASDGIWKVRFTITAILQESIYLQESQDKI